MQQKDTIENQIEKLSLFLKRLISKIIDSSSSETTEEVSIDLQTALHLNSIDFSELDENKIDTLIIDNSLTELHLEQLSEIAYLLGKNNLDSNSELAIKYLTVSSRFLQKADTISGNFSLIRKTKMNSINNLIHKELE